MATVPAYEQQIREAPLPSVRQDSVATPALLGSEADSMAAAGKGMSDAGIGLGAIAYHMQERQDMTAILGVEAARKEKMIAADADMRKNMQGANAAGVTQAVKDWWDNAAKEDMAALQTDGQREIYKRRMQATRLTSLHSTSQFETVQSQNALVDSTNAAVQSSINAAAANAINTTTKQPDEVGIALQAESITSALRALGKSRGEDKKGPNGEPSLADVNISKAITEMHKQVIQSLPPELQRDYFLKHEQEIDGSQRDVIGKAAKRETADAVGQDAASKAIAQYGYDAGIDKIADVLRKQFGTDTVTLKAAITSLKEQVGEYEHGQKTRVEQAAAKVNTALLNGASWGQVSRSPEFRSLITDNGAEGIKMGQTIQDHQESLMATRASRAASEANRSYTQAAHAQIDLSKKGMDTYLDLMLNPDKLAAKTTEQVINLRTQMSDEQVQRLSQAHVQLTKSAEAFAGAKVDAETFKALAINAGLHPDKKLDEGEKDRLALLKNAVDYRLSALAKAQGKPLTPEQKVIEAQKAFDDKIRTPGFWSGTIMGDTLPAGALTTEERNTSLKKEMPAAFEREATAALVKAGRPVTEDAILQAWALNRKTWKPTPIPRGLAGRGYVPGGE